MKVLPSEFDIILQELHRNEESQLAIYPYLGSRPLCLLDLEKQSIPKIVSIREWNEFLEEVRTTHNLSDAAFSELPYFSDIVRAFIASGILQPEGIDILLQKIYEDQFSKELKNTDKVFIALDTNQLIYNTMSNFVEKAYSKEVKDDLQPKIQYLVAHWVIWEKNQFLRTENNPGVQELRKKFRSSGFNLKEKVDKKSRLGYSIVSELKALEPAVEMLENKDKKLNIDSSRVMGDKSQRDIAILSEYQEVSRKKEGKVFYVTSDMQVISIAMDYIEHVVPITFPLQIDYSPSATLTQFSNLIYQLTHLFGRLTFNKYGISSNIWFPQKSHEDWARKQFVFSCSNKRFWQKIRKSIDTNRKRKD